MTYFTEYFCLIFVVFLLNVLGGCGNMWTSNNRFRGDDYMLHMHNSDRGKKAAELWRVACSLYNLLQIDLSGYPKGTVISKNSRQRRTLKSGVTKIYTYHYENADVAGVGQFHLPVKIKFKRGKRVVTPAYDANDPKIPENLWDMRQRILYRREIEGRIEYQEKRAKELIQGLNLYKNSREELETLEAMLELAGRAMRRKGEYEACKRRAKKRLLTGTDEESGWNKFYGMEKGIVTNLGETVRSKNECLFANKLNELGIGYVYEMIIGDEVAPDFTVFIQKEVFYIEVLGMMEQDEYREKLEEKIEKYRRLNIVPGENLVLIDMTRKIDMQKIGRILTGLFAGQVPAEIVAAG